MQRTDQLCQLFELIWNLKVHYGKLNESITQNKNVNSREKIANQILQTVYKGNDKYLASKGVHDRIDALVKASSIIQKCTKLWEA